LPCASNSDYIKRREYWIVLIKGVHGYDCEKTKTLMLRLLYLGNYYKSNKIPDIVEYAKELSGIANRLWKDADDKTKKLVKEDVKRKKKKDIKLKDSKATLMSWHIQSIECSILVKVYQWFTDNGYMVGQFCHDSLTIEYNKHNNHPDLLPKDVIDEVNNAINEIGGEYNYENYTVTLSKKEMKIKDLGNIIVDPNVLPPRGKKKMPAKLVKEKTNNLTPNNVTPNDVTPKVLTFKKPSMHRSAIDGHSHIYSLQDCQVQ